MEGLHAVVTTTYLAAALGYKCNLFVMFAAGVDVRGNLKL
jgi:hypothetical protein